MDKSVIVCKCEEVNIDEIETALKTGARHFDDVKRLTRCGMGPCQSKLCGGLVRRVISEYRNVSISEVEPPKKRMPISMIRLKALATDKEATKVISVFKESVSGVSRS
ncbi:(2Fe-2S)-binding protein [Edaphobacillus lindanitolerans]|uniref:BFD-like [2Fe-2S] binding domain-containing protein n=1 Tax=Edaphobacillus lindanitolerans TaxID=550447 RepID=A0A1U7PN36_9BACI|nr:(2Fe-2S)-binding protein [Edaphobacillus lindanitolerans]SIT73251.1 BFD-like [2Fe-2S] binding domain-containing protein [Edaphobacillus lindanitolerans]